MRAAVPIESDPLAEVDPRRLGSRLREAREARAWTQAHVAGELGIARTTLVALEKGERRARAEELVELARLYGRSLSQLLQRGEPAEGFAVQLRSALPGPSTVDAELLAAIAELEGLCEDYRWLEELRRAPLRRRYPPPFDVEGVDPAQAAEDVAGEERRRLGLGDAPLASLRGVLEADVGLRIFGIGVPASVAGMYAFTEPLGGCIGVNRDHPAERARLTLAHEYGHFLTSRFRAEILDERRYERLPQHERFAEAFARAFLMPSAGLRRRFLGLQRQRLDGVSRSDVLRLAHSYAVAPEIMVRRLEEIELVPSGTWDRLRADGLRVGEARRLLGLEPVAEGDPLPARFVSLAVEAWQEGDLSEGQVARLLRTSRLELRSRFAAEEGAVGPSLILGTPVAAGVRG
jgi:Zn-dependent peptidase ImmA (M78 family)/transcriptional regulator with XRE-family HTH domain